MNASIPAVGREVAQVMTPTGPSLARTARSLRLIDPD